MSAALVNPGAKRTSAAASWWARRRAMVSSASGSAVEGTPRRDRPGWSSHWACGNTSAAADGSPVTDIVTGKVQMVALVSPGPHRRNHEKATSGNRPARAFAGYGAGRELLPVARDLAQSQPAGHVQHGHCLALPSALPHLSGDGRIRRHYGESGLLLPG